MHKPYFVNLDALRFFAFLCVFCSHCVAFFGYTFPNHYVELIHLHFFLNGNLGVSFFFVLSGFLITWLLSLEKEETGTIRVGSFYMRRVLRIWPVYFLVVAAGFIIGTQLHSALLDKNHFLYPISVTQLKWYVLFLANYDLMLNGISSVILSVLWSVSVEEQFYLVWPLLFILFTRKKLVLICWVLIAISFTCRCFYSEYSSFSTFEVMSDLAAGGLIAHYCRTRPAFTGFFKALRPHYIIIIYVLFFLAVPLKGFSHIFGERLYNVYYPFEKLIFAGFFGFIIMEQTFALRSFFKFGSVALFTRLGKISYGLYAYHMLCFPLAYMVAGWFGLSPGYFVSYLIKILTSFLLTCLISSLSYRFYEKKILALKKYFPAGGLTP